jgi:hypothetical protein
MLVYPQYALQFNACSGKKVYFFYLSQKRKRKTTTFKSSRHIFMKILNQSNVLFPCDHILTYTVYVKYCYSLGNVVAQ